MTEVAEIVFPAEAKKLSAYVSKINASSYEKLKNRAIKVVKQGKQMTPEAWRKIFLEVKGTEDEEPAALAFSGLLAFFQTIAREQKKGLNLDNLRLPDALKSDLETAISDNFLGTSEKPDEDHEDVEIDWEVAGVLGNSFLPDATKPAVLLNFRQTDGSTNRLSLTYQQFQSMRFLVARQLKEMHDLEERKALKIT